MGNCQALCGYASDIRDFYTIGQKVGTGAFGQVRLCTHKETGEERAVKLIVKDEVGVTIQELMEEIEVLKLVNHPNVITFYEWFEDRNFIYAVMELCTGGELFSRLEKSRHFSEATASKIMKQMILAVEHLHEQHIIHRDLKPENFLFKDASDASPLKVIDFGLSKRVKNNKELTDCCGTIHYLAPEIIKGKAKYWSDMWAIGVILYLLLYGKLPFKGANDQAIMKNIITKNPDIAPMSGSHPISEHARDLLKRLLRKNHLKRITATEALQHPWIKAADDVQSGSDGRIDPEILQNARQSVLEARKKPGTQVERRRETLLQLEDQSYQKCVEQRGKGVPVQNHHHQPGQQHGSGVSAAKRKSRTSSIASSITRHKMRPPPPGAPPRPSEGSEPRTGGKSRRPTLGQIDAAHHPDIQRLVQQYAATPSTETVKPGDGSAHGSDSPAEGSPGGANVNENAAASPGALRSGADDHTGSKDVMESGATSPTSPPLRPVNAPG